MYRILSAPVISMLEKTPMHTKPTPATNHQADYIAKVLPPLDEESPLQSILHQEIVGSGLLIFCAVAALIIANSPYGAVYHHYLNVKLGISFGAFHFDRSIHHWINDGLMSLFFFMVGLEIKREICVGELADIRKAMLPIAAAFGGMVVPAIIYSLINMNSSGSSGWGVPMATDIAFAAGCIALLRKWIPPSLLVFLVALAIVDDLGAVCIIAVFYTEKIATTPLLLGTILILISFCMGLLGVRVATPYAVIGIIIWLTFLQSGVHATIAGVLLAFSIPVTARYRTGNFHVRVSELMRRFLDAESLWKKDKDGKPLNVKKDEMINHRQQTLIQSINWECHHVEAPLQRIERSLEPFCMFVIMPLFAFANAGMHLDFSHGPGQMFHPVTLGIIGGLVFGKPLGILLASLLSVKVGLAELPRNVNWKQITGVGCLAGIGFTMSLFINELAFRDAGAHSDSLMAAGKTGVFAASLIAAVTGLVVLKKSCRTMQKSSDY